LAYGRKLQRAAKLAGKMLSSELKTEDSNERRENR